MNDASTLTLASQVDREVTTLIQKLGGSVNEEQMCFSDTCACNSHDSSRDQVVFPLGTTVEHLLGTGCTSDTCACNNHPSGYTGVSLYTLPDGATVVARGNPHREDMGHAPRLSMCDPNEIRAEMDRLESDYNAVLDRYQTDRD